MSILDILLVIENKHELESCQRFIAQSDKIDSSIRVAKTAKDGLAEIQKKKPDCVLLDYQLPDASGLEFLSQLNEVLSEVDFSIVMMTGRDSENIAAEAMEQGANDYVLKSQITNDILTQSILNAIEKNRLLNDSDDNSTSKALAYRDPLTKLLKRAAFEDSLREHVALALRYEYNLGILYIDLDYFKDINEELGHAVGDRVLKEVSKRILSCTRREDFAARLEADEFVLALSRIRYEIDAGRVARKILTEISKEIDIEGLSTRVKASIGIAMLSQTKKDPSKLLANADRAKYQAKKSGRNCYRYYSDNLNQKHDQRMCVERSLTHAIRDGAFKLNYHPIFDIKMNKIFAIGATAYWEHPDLGAILEEKYIHVAEDSHQVDGIDMWKINNVPTLITETHADKNPNRYFAIKISPLTLSLHNITDRIHKAVFEAGFLPENLILELTSTNLSQSLESLSPILDTLSGYGIQIATSDYLSVCFSMELQRYKNSIKILKINQQTLSRLVNGDYDLYYFENICNTANHLNIKVIAEGVTTEEEIAFLTQHGCTLAQGKFCNQLYDSI